MATQIPREGATARLLSNPAATDVVVVEPVWQPEAAAILGSAPSASEAADGP
jgi:rod shape-determining protein MreC